MPSSSPFGPHQSTPSELRARLEAERQQLPFLVLRDARGAQHVLALGAEDRRLTVGRAAHSDVLLSWDAEVSRLHAELECVGGQWLASDEGLSRNGTYVNGERLNGRRRLHDGDVLRAGTTSILFRAPEPHSTPTTMIANHRNVAASMTDAQRRVLVALCRPFKDDAMYAVPATNAQIAEELVLSVPAVKTQLRALFRAFGIDDLPQQKKRLRLVALAFSGGIVRRSDL